MRVCVLSNNANANLVMIFVCRLGAMARGRSLHSLGGLRQLQDTESDQDLKLVKYDRWLHRVTYLL